MGDPGHSGLGGTGLEGSKRPLSARERLGPGGEERGRLGSLLGDTLGSEARGRGEEPASGAARAAGVPPAGLGPGEAP